MPEPWKHPSQAVDLNQQAPVSRPTPSVDRSQEGPIKLDLGRMAGHWSPAPRTSATAGLRADDQMLLQLHDRTKTYELDTVIPERRTSRRSQAPLALDQESSIVVMSHIRNVGQAIRADEVLSSNPKWMAHAMGAQTAAERLFSMRDRIEKESDGQVSRAAAIFGANIDQYKAAGKLLTRINDIPTEIARIQQSLKLDQEGVERQTQLKLASIARDARSTLGLTFNVTTTASSIGIEGMSPLPYNVDQDLLVAYLQGFQASCVHPGSTEFVSAYDVASATISGRALSRVNSGRHDAYSAELHEAAEGVRRRIQANANVDAAYAANLVTIYKDELEEVAKGFVAPGHPRMADMVMGMQFAAFRAAGRSIEAKRVACVVDDPEAMPEVAPDPVEEIKKEAHILDDYIAAGASLLNAGDRGEFEAAKVHLKDAFLALPDILQDALFLSPKPMDPVTLSERGAASHNAVEDYKVRFLMAPEMKPQPGFGQACTPGSNTIMVRGEGGQVLLAQADQTARNVRIYELDQFGNAVRFRQDGKDTWRLEDAPKLSVEAMTYLSLVGSKDNVNHFLNNAIAAKKGITPIEIEPRPVDRYLVAPVLTEGRRFQEPEGATREVFV